MVGAPVSRTRVPAGGDWRATWLAAAPCTEPMPCQANPVSSRVPLANTNAWPDRSGTTRVGTGTGAGAPCGTAVICFAAPTARVVLASSRTTPTIARRGKRVAIRRAMVRESAESGLDSSPTPSENDDGIPRIGDDGEDPPRRGRGVGQFEWRRGVLPAERDAREALEPGLILWVGRRWLELEMEMRPGRMARRSDETDLSPRCEGDAVHDGGIEVGEVAVRPDLTVRRADRHADAAAGVVRMPGVEDDCVRDRVHGRTGRRGDVGRGVVVMRVGDRDDLRPTAYWKDVIVVKGGRSHQRPDAPRGR